MEGMRPFRSLYGQAKRPGSLEPGLFVCPYKPIKARTVNICPLPMLPRYLHCSKTLLLGRAAYVGLPLLIGALVPFSIALPLRLAGVFHFLRLS